jgi:predicted CXXCH cytochrome family protein
MTKRRKKTTSRRPATESTREPTASEAMELPVAAAGDGGAAARRSRTHLAIAGAAVIVMLISSVAIWKLTSSPAPAPVVAPVPADALAITMPAFAADAGVVPHQKYVGSTACGDCHDDELKNWQKSWHARALSPATDKFIVGNYDNAHFKGTSSEATMTRRGAARAMKTQGPDGKVAEFPVNWVIGGKRMQDAITVFPDGRWQVLPVYYHVTAKSWVDYTEAKQGPLTPEHPFWWTNARRMANHECLDCHTTNLAVSHDDATGKWTTTATDFTVACESCHGAGGLHADPAGNGKGHITQPVKAGAAGVAACARCHGPRQPLWPLLDTEHRFEIGADYDEAYDPIVVTLPGGGTSSDFFADARPATSSFEYQAMLQSACYRKGKATCLTCHTAPHEAKRKAELRDEPDKICKSCHKDLAADHSHHSAKATCISCHMPPVVNGVLDKFADHSIDIPAASARHPNACGTCHADKSLDKLAEAIKKWWPDATKRQARRERLADAFDEATAAASTPALQAVIADKEEAPTLRGAAAITLARRTHATAVDAVLPLLASPSLVLRAKGCEALGDAHARTTGDAVAKLLADRSLRVRLACSLALFDMRDPRGELALRQLATDPTTTRLMLPHLELGRAAMRRHDYATGKAELAQVATLAPYFTDALVELAAAYAELGDLPEARRRVQAVLAVEPNHHAAVELARKLQ